MKQIHLKSAKIAAIGKPVKKTKKRSKKITAPRQRGPVDWIDGSTTEREGIHVLYDSSTKIKSANKSTNMTDIIFVHDYGGNALLSWSTTNNEIWLRDWLPTDLNKNIRVLSMGYKLTASKLSTDIGRVSRHALNHLLQLRKNHNKRPLVWVGHGIGGWIIKDCIQKTKISKKKEYHQLYDHSEAVVFLGTPHVNTDNTLLDHSLACLFSQSKRLPTAINVSGEYVRDLNEDFVFSVERQGMRVLNISETLPTKLANNIHAVTVPSSVTTMSAEGLTNVTAESDHNQLVSYANKSSSVYTIVLEFLRSITK
jgi:hypothetical protein